MNSILFKFYIRKGNSSKIKNLSEDNYNKLYDKLSFDDKIRLAHLRGNVIDNLDGFDLMVKGNSLYELLDDKNSLMFYLELLDYINKDVMYDNGFIKRFNIPLWKNKLEESGYFNFSAEGIYNLIGRNQDLFISLLNDLKYREIFFRNVSFDGNLYELKIDKILSFDKIALYLSNQKEMEKFYNKKCASMFYSLDESFFKSLPDEYKFLIGYHVSSKKDKIKNVLVSYFPYLSNDEVDDILSLYNSNVSRDNIASLISLMIEDNNFYNKFNYLLNNYFDGDYNKTIVFCNKYKNTKLFDDICFNYVDGIKDKLVFLSFSNRLKGIDSLESILDISVDDLKKMENDFSNYKVVKDDVRVFGNKDLISLKYEREIVVINSNGEVDEREVTQSHDEVIYDFIKENNYNHEGPNIFRNMVITLANEGNIIILIEGDNVICTLPKLINSIQKNSLSDLFKLMNDESEIGICFVDDNEIYALNDGIMMNSNSANRELFRIKSL